MRKLAAAGTCRWLGSTLKATSRPLLGWQLHCSNSHGVPNCRDAFAVDSDERHSQHRQLQHTALTIACGPHSLALAGNKDKKLAALDIVNVSIKIYFRLNTLRLCKNLIRTVDSRQVRACGCLVGACARLDPLVRSPGALACPTRTPWASCPHGPRNSCCSLPTLMHSRPPSA